LYKNVIFPGQLYHPFKPGGYDIASFILANIRNRPIFLCGGWKTGDHSHQNFDLKNFGLTQQIVPKTGDVMTDSEEADAQKLTALFWPETYEFFSEKIFPNTNKLLFLRGNWDREILNRFMNSLQNHARDFLELALSTKYLRIKERALDSAIENFVKILNYSSYLDNYVLLPVYFNLGLSYDHFRSLLKSEHDLQQNAEKLVNSWRQYLNLVNQEKAILFYGEANPGVDAETLEHVERSVVFWENHYNFSVQ